MEINDRIEERMRNLRRRTEAFREELSPRERQLLVVFNEVFGRELAELNERLNETAGVLEEIRRNGEEALAL